MNTSDFKNLLKSTEQTILFSKKYNFYRKTFEASTRKANALTHLGLLPVAKKILEEMYFTKIEPTDPRIALIGNFGIINQQFYEVQNN